MLRKHQWAPADRRAERPETDPRLDRQKFTKYTAFVTLARQCRDQGTTGASNGREHALVPETRMGVIVSGENEWIKSFRTALQGTGPHPGEPIGIEGTKLVVDAIRSGLEIEALLVSQTGERNLERILWAASESQSGISRQHILRTTDKLFSRLAATESPQ